MAMSQQDDESHEGKSADMLLSFAWMTALSGSYGFNFFVVAYMERDVALRLHLLGHWEQMIV